MRLLKRPLMSWKSGTSLEKVCLEMFSFKDQKLEFLANKPFFSYFQLLIRMKSGINCHHSIRASKTPSMISTRSVNRESLQNVLLPAPNSFLCSFLICPKSLMKDRKHCCHWKGLEKILEEVIGVEEKYC